jgi:hypothetical protein
MNITTNLLRHWRSATREHRQSGAEWYRRAHQTVCALASASGHSRSTVAGVVAATSPRMHWSRNIAVSETLLAGGTPTGVFRTSLDKARRIIAGAKPLAVLGGNKVRAFYRALLGDKRAAVVDVWMVRAVGLDPTTKLTDGLYARIAGALQALASKLRIAVADLQATIWVAVRGRAE